MSANAILNSTLDVREGHSRLAIISRETLVEELINWIDNADAITIPRIEFSMEEVIDIGGVIRDTVQTSGERMELSKVR